MVTMGNKCKYCNFGRIPNTPLESYFCLWKCSFQFDYLAKEGLTIYLTFIFSMILLYFVKISFIFVIFLIEIWIVCTSIVCVY